MKNTYKDKLLYEGIYSEEFEKYLLQEGTYKGAAKALNFNNYKMKLCVGYLYWQYRVKNKKDLIAMINHRLYIKKLYEL